jgi:hypothetical protein
MGLMALTLSPAVQGTLDRWEKDDPSICRLSSRLSRLRL